MNDDNEIVSLGDSTHPQWLDTLLIIAAAIGLLAVAYVAINDMFLILPGD